MAVATSAADNNSNAGEKGSTFFRLEIVSEIEAGRKPLTERNRKGKPMFIRKTSHGYYDRNGSQHSGKGDYLVLFSWNDFKAMDEIRSACVECQNAKKAYAFNTWRVRECGYLYMSISDLQKWANQVYNSYQSCEVHRSYKATPMPEHQYENGKPMLWAIVRQTAMHQMGHWMMGTINIGGHRMTVSGEVGSDGLPGDYQGVPVEHRVKLIQVPEDVATVYWNGNGHNEVGSGRDALQQWALAAFPGKGQK
jgi:hypothetical protein